MSMKIVERALRMGEGRKVKAYQAMVGRVTGIEPEMELHSDEELRQAADALRERARNGESFDDLLFDTFALVREASKRTLGMRPYDVQIMGGAVLHDGKIAEMKTGEGKTLAATLPLVLNSLKSDGSHLVTVNDYLARRDAEWMSPIYEMLGVSVGVIQDNMSPEERNEAYGRDITYGTNSEFGFDYLRDNMAGNKDEVVQGRHRYAIVDEVDNILIDEARTPLIISGAPEKAADLYAKFAKLAPILELGKMDDNIPKHVRQKMEKDYDYEADEKHKTISITERGVAKTEKFLGIDNLYIPEYGNLVNHQIQALKAESLYKIDVDYVVQDGEVKIVDEFTGRILEGRRWSEGLHQAVEAKEGVPVLEENQTLATITLQNYFRLYEKLAGMTGTAVTEASEFDKIYKLDTISVPTNEEMIRADFNDKIFKTKDGKWKAVVREIEERHEKGQPILIGTVSIEVSELVGDSLKKKGIDHSVLNARPEYAQREGETIANAGRKGAVTIATNMAGRGVDILLGGSPEQLTKDELKKRGVGPLEDGYKEAWDEVFPKMEEQCKVEHDEVVDLGGLFVLGTERHESRRIDNQLRGRSGRQGDLGESLFYLSAQDDLVRLFAGDRIYRILDRMGPVDEEGEEQPIEAKMLSRTIENAQKKVEQQNFLMRKSVLEYDDVMNQQREVIYGYRERILEGKDMGDTAREEMGRVITDITGKYAESDYPEDWDLDGLFTQLEQIYPVGVDFDELGGERMTKEELAQTLSDDLLERYSEHEKSLGEELMRNLERAVLLQVIDSMWREHLYDMDYLREGIGLRAIGQKDPLVEYKNEGYKLFVDTMHSIWEDFAKYIFHLEVEGAEQETSHAFAPSSSSTTAGGRVSYSGGGPIQPSALEIAAEQQEAGVPVGAGAEDMGEEVDEGEIDIETRTLDEKEKVGRNDPCWCGSGKKYKKCHGA